MAKEEVRDGFLGDLPEEIQTKVMNIHKLIIDGVNAEFKRKKYDSIRDQQWAKSWLDEFFTMPTDKNHVGSVRVYKKGKRFSCMIQMTGHVTNNRNTDDEELFHGLIRNAHTALRSKIRRKFDVTIECESVHGEPFEGYDIWTKQNVAKDIWEKFGDKKTKTVTEVKESVIVSGIEELPYGLQKYIETTNIALNDYISEKSHGSLKYCYRIGFDANTGEQVAVQFKLDKEQIKAEDYTRPDMHRNIMYQAIYRDNNGWVGNVDLRNGLEGKADYLKKHITKSGHIDFITDELPINSIFTKGGKKLDSVDFIPMLSNTVSKVCRVIIPQITGKITETTFDEVLNSDIFKKKLVEFIKGQPTLIEHYRVGELGGKDKYKTTKLIWKTEIFNSLALNPVVRGEVKKGPVTIFNANDDNLMKPLAREYWHNHGIVKNKTVKEYVDLYCKEYNVQRNDEDINLFIINEWTSLFENMQTDAAFNVVLYMAEMHGIEGKRLNDIQNIMEFAESYDETNDIGFTVLKKIGEHYEGSIILTPEVVCEDVENDDIAFEYALNKFIDIYEKEYDPTKLLYLRGEENTRFFEYQLTESYARLLYEWMCANDKANYFESYDEFNLNNPYWVWDPFTESDNTPEYNVDMDEKQAKKTLQTLSQNILNDVEKDEKYKVSQYTANIYANIITKNLLPLWAKGYRKFTINISQNTSNTLEFKIPSMTKDFVSRFVEGRESINGLLHRNPEIKITMSANIFNTMKTPNDAFNFFKAAIKYYDRGIVTYGEKLMAEVMKLNREMKHLISTTKLSGVVTFPIHMLLVFDNVDMSDIKTFMINNEDIKTVNNFIRNIYSRYASPEKEKNKIIEDLNKMIDSFNESCDDIGDGRYLSEAVNDLFTGKFNDEMIKVKEEFIRENVDVNWSRNQKDRDVKFLIEKFGVKKLKKIPRDLIAYISIEAESIQDANDKMMIASYCLSKLEIVEWYIELLDIGSKKYIVPHTKPELERIHTQLLACYKKIMDVKVKNPNDRPLIDIKYPVGYEG